MATTNLPLYRLSIIFCIDINMLIEILAREGIGSVPSPLRSVERLGENLGRGE